MTVNEHTYLKEEELIRLAIETLVSTLGPVETARFLTMTQQQKLDAVKRHREWQDTLDKEQFFDQIFK